MRSAAVRLGPWHDGAIFGVVGEAVSRGDMPYLDVWDHKPPGNYLVAALATLAPGPTWTALWSLSVAATVVTGLAVRHVTDTAVGPLAVICMSSWSLSVGGWTNRDICRASSCWGTACGEPWPVVSGWIHGGRTNGAKADGQILELATSVTGYAERHHPQGRFRSGSTISICGCCIGPPRG